MNLHRLAIFLILAALLAAPSVQGQDTRAAYAKQYLRHVYSILDGNFLYPVKEQSVIKGAVEEMRRTVPGVSFDGSYTWKGLDGAFDSVALRDPSAVSLLGEAAIRGMVEGLGDPYSSFLNARELALVRGQLAGESFTGIGVELAPSKSGLVIVAALEGGPALKAGLRCRDMITAVNGVPVKGKSFDGAANLLLGESGSTVTLKIVRDGTAFTKSLRRAVLRIPPASSTMVDERTGYLKISIFSRVVLDEVRSALGKVRGIERLIIDLRNNPGGDFEAALNVASCFVPPRAPLVKVRSRGKPDKTYISRASSARGIPIALLVNGGTASSSEILTCALRDSAKGRIIGTRTFGKGLVQTYFPLVGNTAVRLTTGKYLSPSGEDIHNKGITPHITLPANAGDKAWIEAALNALEVWPKSLF
jgi:carboxyl-terminal processing protease